MSEHRHASAEDQGMGTSTHLPTLPFDRPNLRAFADPDRFEAAREPNPHLTFGHGRRYCMGAALARVELQAVFGTLFRRFPALEVAVPIEELRTRRDLLTGGLVELPVRW